MDSAGRVTPPSRPLSPCKCAMPQSCFIFCHTGRDVESTPKFSLRLRTPWIQVFYVSADQHEMSFKTEADFAAISAFFYVTQQASCSVNKQTSCSH